MTLDYKKKEGMGESDKENVQGQMGVFFLVVVDFDREEDWNELDVENHMTHQFQVKCQCNGYSDFLRN